MSDTAPPPIADLTAPDMPPANGAASKEDRRFYIGLAVAMLLHSLLFAGFYGSPPRIVGDPNGDKDAISVAIVSEAELRSLSTAADKPAGQPAPPAPPPTPSVAPTPPPAPASQPPAPTPEPAPEPVPEPPLPRESALPEAALTLKPVEEPPTKAETKPEPTATPRPKTEPAPPAKAAKPSRTQSAKLDLSPPAMFSAPSGMGGAGLQRPPGITRSGENDTFARGVVSALQRTMPQLSNTRGRVTVRITLDKDGSLEKTEVVIPSRVAGLDRSVVFATRQTSYPFPPRNAKPADLVFLITYIYN